jgi:hypothetical protein
MRSHSLAILFCIFGLISLFLIPITSFSQSGTTLSSTSEVNGRYIHPDGEVEMTLPVDWKSVEATLTSGRVVVSAPSDFTIGTLNELDVAMYLIIYEKTLVERAPDSAPPFGTTDAQCVVELDGSTIVSNAISKLSTYQCKIDEKDVSVRSVLTETSDRWVSLMLVTDIPETDDYVPIFNKALETLLVRDAISMDINPDIIHTIKTVNVNGTNVFVEVRSSSNLTDFVFDEERVILTFTVQGRIGTEGVTDMAIGKIIEGPYSVTIDDTITNNFELLEGKTREDNRIVVTYGYNPATRIAVSGARAVPELPSNSLTLSAIALTSAAVVLSRYGLRKSL